MKPPLKLDNTITGHDEAENVTDFLARKVKNFRKLLVHPDFKGHFTLKLHLRVDKFDLERDQLNTNMYLPSTQILYDDS